MNKFLLILTIVSGGLVFAEKLFKKKYSKTISTITFIVFITSSILVFVGEIDKEKSISEFQKQILDKNEEISKLNNEVSNILKEYGSFCYVEISNLNNKSGHLSGFLTIFHKGNYPIDNINIHISDSYKKPPKNYTLEEVIKGDIIFNINSLSPNSSELKGRINFEDHDSLKFSISINSQYGEYHEILEYKKVGEEWASALKVSKFNKKEGKEGRESWDTVLEKIDTLFPLSKEEKINWDSSF